MGGVGSVQDHGSSVSDLFGSAVVDVGWRVEADARMTMFVVIPAEESTAVGVGVLEGAEAVRELRPILEGAEVRFGIRVVVGLTG